MKAKTLPLIFSNQIDFWKRFSLSTLFALFMAFSLNAQTTTVVDIIVNSPDHEELEDAVIAAELDDDLSGSGPFTVFAPTDDAFAALGQETINALFADPTGELADILKYHVVGAEALSSSLSDGQMITTLNGDSIKVTIDQAGDVFIDDAKVTAADIQTDNGVVHVIDAVIVPEYTVVDVVVASADHTSLEAAVTEAGLAETLAGEGPFTVFAPTDDAFAALGQETINALFADPTGELADILKYHVVSGDVMAGDLSDGQIVEMLEGTDAFISLFDEMAYINQAEISMTDITTDNGIVHVIDAVITQPTSIVDIVANSPRHNTLETAVIEAELVDALSAEGTFTLFAPTDDAFAALGQETIDALLAEPTGDLANILKYHVVGATAFSGELSNGQTFTTLEGSEITVTINGDVMIDDAKVIFADYEAPNGVVHVIDAVIQPEATTNIKERSIFSNTRVYPNPASDRINFSFELDNASEVSIDVYDMIGQKVAKRNLGTLPTGGHNYTMGTESMENGIYIIIVNSGDSTFANKVRVVR